MSALPDRDPTLAPGQDAMAHEAARVSEALDSSVNKQEIREEATTAGAAAIEAGLNDTSGDPALFRPAPAVAADPTELNNEPSTPVAPAAHEKQFSAASSSFVIADDKIPQELLKPSSPGSSATNVATKKPRGLKALFKKKKGEEKETSDMVPPVGLFKLFRFATPFELFLQVIGLILAAACGAAQPLMTLIFGKLTQSFTDFSKIINEMNASGRPQSDFADALQTAKDGLKHEAGNNALYLMAIGLGTFACTWAYMFIWAYTSEIQAKRIREKYLHAVLRQDIAYFDDLGAGEVATRIESDCHLVQVGIGEKIPISFSFVATFITGYVLAYARHAKLAGAITAILPVIMIAGTIMGIAGTKYTTGSLTFVSKAGTLAEEVISSIRTVQAFGAKRTLGAMFDSLIGKSRDVGIKGAAVEGVGLGVMFFAIYSAQALAFAYGAILTHDGDAQVGVVINVFMSILIGSFSIAMLAPELQAVTKAKAAAAKLYDTIDRVPPIDSEDPNGLKLDEVHGHITFEHVAFHYPSRPNVPVLKDLTVDFEAGKTSALCGASGSGKSTVIQLIERFYDPISGVVKLDGHDIRSLNLRWLRQQIGLVSQEPVLFATTVRGNVEHGLIGSRWENASDEERFNLVKQACIDANAHDFITKLPAGYDTIVGERGMLLSGGQKQRVAIARAIVSDPRILLLDEATSALDGLSERIVQDALDKASIGRTTIVVAHRLATIKDADKILVMGSGEVLEEGTHNSLLEDEDGAYFKLVSNQKLNQTGEGMDEKEVLEDPDEILDEKVPLPASPMSEKSMLSRQMSPELFRAQTGRSIASQVLEQSAARREEEAEAQRKIPFMKLFFRLLKLNKDQKQWYIFGTFGAVCSGMVYPALSILFGKSINDFAIIDLDEMKREVFRKALWYFITAILAAICILVQITGFGRVGWQMLYKLRIKAFSSVMRHDVEWFDKEENSTGGVTSNLSDHPQKVQGLMGVTLGSIIQSCATLIGGIIIGLCYAPLLALIGMACIPLVISSGYIRLRVVVLKDEKNKKWHAASAQMASEAAGAVRTVASLTREQDVDSIYSNSLKAPLKIALRTAIYSQALYAASQGIAFLVIALVFYVGALWIVDGRYSTAQFFTGLTATVFAAIQAGNVFMFVPDASSANSAAHSIFALFDNVPDIDADSPEGKILDPAQVKGHITLQNIHFRYPSRPSVRVLRNLSIEVPPGKYVALVGPSGCGKSTTIQLIERFYDPMSGVVKLDGVDVRELNVASYRNQIALVSQEPTLYAGTIRFNILLGAAKPADEVTEDEIVQACKDANIYDFIMSLPDGFDTEVGGKGSQLSGGQKQRIAIARALVRDPKVLLLDEATAALDSTSERVVQQALDNASKGRSTIAIAHRLATIQAADIIYYVEGGAVTEQGTHAELIALKGAYYELVQMQNLSKLD